MIENMLIIPYDDSYIMIPVSKPAVYEYGRIICMFRSV